MEPQKGMYAMYFKKNGLAYAKETISAVAAAMTRRDWQTAGNLLLTSTESVITGPTAIIE